MDDDLDWVIKMAKGMAVGEGNEKPFFNAASSLPASKKKMKLAIKERIRLLCGAYISLASFISDDDIDVFTNDETSKESRRVIVQKVFDEMEKNRKEIEEFRPLNLENEI